MNKKTRVGLIVLVAVILTLALTIPGLAKKAPKVSCYISTLTINGHGDFNISLKTFGDLEAYWEDGVLYNFCTGEIPLGEEISPEVRIATFEEVCEFFYLECEKNVLVLTPDNVIADMFYVEAFDPDTNHFYEATDYFAEMRKNGKIIFYKEYTPPEE